jgi:hypothetical protein
MVCIGIAFMALCDLFNHLLKTRLMRWCLARVYDLQAIHERFFIHHRWTVDNIKRRDAAKWVKIEAVDKPKIETKSTGVYSWAVEVKNAEIGSYTTSEIEVLDSE